MITKKSTPNKKLRTYKIKSQDAWELVFAHDVAFFIKDARILLVNNG